MSSLKKTVDLLFSQKYLIFTNVTLGGTFLGAGDLIEQFLNRKIFNSNKNDDKLKEKLKNSEFDLNRASAMAKSGLIIGCCGHYWYKFLDNKFPGTNKLTIIKKLGCEMAIGIPWIFLTFATVGFFEGQKFNDSLNKFKESFIYVLAADWLFYVPLQSLNFKFLPPKYRFAYVCCLTVIYDIFLAFILHK